MNKCNRTVCKSEGEFAHVDIVVGHDGKPARYCAACAALVNRANKPMAGYPLIPTSMEEIAAVLAYKLGQPLELPANREHWLPYLAARDRDVHDLGVRLLDALPAHLRPARAA